MTTTAAEDIATRGDAAPPLPRTMADVLHDLGDVPPERVWSKPAPGTATVEDVLAIEERWNRLCELVDGVLVEKAMGYEESALAIWIAGLVGTFVDQRKLGIVTGADGMVQLFPGLVRIPDVAFASIATLKGRGPGSPRVPRIAPDLVVEVRSLGNTSGEMDRKREEYFAAGVKLLWLVEPRRRLVTVLDSTNPPVILDESGTLTGGNVLAGFSLAVKDIMARWDYLNSLLK